MFSQIEEALKQQAAEATARRAQLLRALTSESGDWNAPQLLAYIGEAAKADLALLLADMVDALAAVKADKTKLLTRAETAEFRVRAQGEQISAARDDDLVAFAESAIALRDGEDLQKQLLVSRTWKADEHGAWTSPDVKDALTLPLALNALIRADAARVRNVLAHGIRAKATHVLAANFIKNEIGTAA